MSALEGVLRSLEANTPEQADDLAAARQEYESLRNENGRLIEVVRLAHLAFGAVAGEVIYVPPAVAHIWREGSLAVSREVGMPTGGDARGEEA